jgi:hypothetical protein
VLTGGLGLAKTTLDITLIGVSTNVPDIGLQVNATFVLNSYVLCGAAVVGTRVRRGGCGDAKVVFYL